MPKYSLSLRWPRYFSYHLRTIPEDRRDAYIQERIDKSRQYYEQNKSAMSGDIQYFWEDLDKQLDHDITRVLALDYLWFLAM